MLLSHSRKFVFIHIPKTGGISIHNSLCKVIKDRQHHVVDRQSNGLEDDQHPFARDVRSQLGHEAWDEYFTFAMVRNPWARLVSWFNMAHMYPPMTRSLWLIKCCNFEQFLMLDNPYPAHVGYNQVDYIMDDDGELLVDFVGRTETISQDYQTICDKLDIEHRLRHANRTWPVDYREFYTAATRQIVADRYHRDIAAFGYTFDGK